MLTRDLSQTLYDMGAIQTGTFNLKNGQISPLYIDLRTIISKPQLLAELAQNLIFKTNSLNFDLVCGVPYNGIPIATTVSLQSGKPMIICRKEQKSHGMKQRVEGLYKPGQKCLVIEDVVTSGLTILETIKGLEDVGLEVEHAICLIDREQGAQAHLKKQGYKLHSLYGITEILDQLVLSQKINDEKAMEIKNFLKKNPFQEP